MQAAKLRKIATPPILGKGFECRWRSWLGTASHPRRLARSRTKRVSTNEDSSANKNIPRNMPVNGVTLVRLRRTQQGAPTCPVSKYCSRKPRLTVREQIPGESFFDWTEL